MLVQLDELDLESVQLCQVVLMGLLRRINTTALCRLGGDLAVFHRTGGNASRFDAFVVAHRRPLPSAGVATEHLNERPAGSHP